VRFSKVSLRNNVGFRALLWDAAATYVYLLGHGGVRRRHQTFVDHDITNFSEKERYTHLDRYLGLPEVWVRGFAFQILGSKSPAQADAVSG